MTTIQIPAWPSFTEEEAERVRRVLLTNRVNYRSGDEGRNFEEEFAGFAQTRHAVALANGTVALEASWKALGIGRGDEVVVTPRSFIASATSIILAGAKPVFADVDPDSQNITAATIEPVLSKNTKAILCVHLAGWPCEMDEIGALAAANDLDVVEDCAQAHGARYRGKSVGSLGVIGAWSFCQDKIMTTAGEGGMITTDRADLRSSIWSYKDHGKSWDLINQPDPPPGYCWLHDSIGTNARMTELQSAIGRIQLRRIAEWRAARTANAEAILEAARRCPALRVPVRPDYIEHAWYKCYVFLRPEALKSDWSRDRILVQIEAEGVPCFSGSCPEIYREKAFDSIGLRPPERLPAARRLGETSLQFLVHPTLRPDDIRRTCDAITKVMGQATR